MDFLSTPLPQTTGTEEVVVKKQVSWNSGMKGCFKHNAETRQQMKASQKKVWDNTERKASTSMRTSAMAKSFHTPYGVFSNVREASQQLGIKYSTLYSRLYCMSDRYYLGGAAE
jgi:hypothetical protein